MFPSNQASPFQGKDNVGAKDVQQPTAPSARRIAPKGEPTMTTMRNSFNMTPGPAAEFGDYQGLNPAAAHYVPANASLQHLWGASNSSTDPFRVQQALQFPAFHAPTPIRAPTDDQKYLARPSAMVGRESARQARSPQPHFLSGIETLLEEDEDKKSARGNTATASDSNDVNNTQWLARIASSITQNMESQGFKEMPQQDPQSHQQQTEQSIYSRTRTDSGSGLGGHALAEFIMSGAANVPLTPAEYAEERRNTDRQPVPCLGPARYKSRHVFVQDEDGEIDELPSMQRQLLTYTLPNWFKRVLSERYTPTLAEAVAGIPMIEPCRRITPSTAGVLRIREIPYASTRAEIIALLGRNSQILAQPLGAQFHAVHIIMERESGKTMDCFVELTSHAEAQHIARTFERRAEAGRAVKVGDRMVDVVVSSQQELMQQLFPRAKNVDWRGNTPVIDPVKPNYYPNQPSSGFQGFLDQEELVALAKHADLDGRAPFASRSPCRLYESIISLVHKYPWHAVEHVFLRERRLLYDLVYRFTHKLATFLRYGDGSADENASLRAGKIDTGRRNSRVASPRDPTLQTLHELSIAGLTCPGFSERQKVTLISMLTDYGFEDFARGRDAPEILKQSYGGQHALSAIWPLQVSCIHPGCDSRVLDFYTYLFRTATTMTNAQPGNNPSTDRRSIYPSAASTASPAAQYKVKLSPLDYGIDALDHSLATIASSERDKLTTLLTPLLTPTPREPATPSSKGPPPSSATSLSRAGTSSSSQFPTAIGPAAPAPRFSFSSTALATNQRTPLRGAPVSNPAAAKGPTNVFSPPAPTQDPRFSWNPRGW